MIPEEEGSKLIPNVPTLGCCLRRKRSPGAVSSQREKIWVKRTRRHAELLRVRTGKGGNLSEGRGASRKQPPGEPELGKRAAGSL